jgi:hypothetical protein
VLILGGLEGEQSPPCASSEIGQHRIDLQSVDLGVIPAATVRRHLPPPILQAGDEGIVAIITLGNVIECLIILNPEGDVPGLPVCPTVESGGGGGGGGGVHWFGLNCAHPTASRTHPVGPNLKKPERNPSANLICHNAPERHQML